MENISRPANPQSIAFSGDNPNAQTSWGVHEDFAGFTKLEIASLMIAQGFVAGSHQYLISERDAEVSAVSIASVKLAKAVIEEANK